MIMEVFELDDYLDTYLVINGIPYLFYDSQAYDNDLIKPADIDDSFLHDLEEDLCTTHIELYKIKRYQAIVKFLKKKYDYRCQLCGYSFKMDNGNYYCEAHHIKELSKGGSQNPSNVLILCPNHHRQFHYASQQVVMSPSSCGVRKVIINGHEYPISLN